ncbi:MAG: 6-carboxytetrahydropterin synthase [Planctomycetota bacterium]|nr:6-carboxytetrahydropterin synthase [Planctomycetota bacterium]
MEHWSIQVDKQYLKFSAAHFLIFPDGSAERLHGHNYRVFVEVDADLSSFGLVIDFHHIKPLIRELLGELDEHFLVPGEHPDLTCERRADGVTEVRYRERYYAAPSEDVIIMPLNNTSAENFAAWIGRELRTRMEQRFDGLVLRALKVGVEETPGQRGVYHYVADS